MRNQTAIAALAAALLLAAAPAASVQARAGEPLLPSGMVPAGMNGPTANTVPGPLLAPHSHGAAPSGASAPGGNSPLLKGLLRFYRAVISPVDGDRCDMAPTCSLYAGQALRAHGAFMGIILTADRLLHEADEQRFVTPLKVRGRVRNETHYPDPLADNVYWLPQWMGGPEVKKEEE